MYLAALLQDVFPFGHGRKKLLRWLKRASGRFTVARSRFDRHMLLDRENYIDHQILLYGGFESGLIAGFAALAFKVKAEIFLDIGANIGLYCLKLADVEPVKRVIAFEPDPRNFAQLAGNVFLNGLTERIELRQEALSDRAGTATFHVQRGGGENFISGQSGFSAQGEGFLPIEVKTARLDDLLALEGKIIAAKIDVEGHEDKVIEGMKRLLAKNSVLIQIEVFPENFAKIETLLKGLGLGLRAKLLEQGHDYLFANFPID
jgi:FkbM family methyltransferase